MASGSQQTSLRDLLRDIPEDDEIFMILISLPRHSDEAVALIGSSLLEHALQKTIVSKFIPLTNSDEERLFNDSKNGPLVNFFAKTSIGYAMGLYGKRTRSDLDYVRRIRNAFAHSKLRISFETKAVEQECNHRRLSENEDFASIAPHLKYSNTCSNYARAFQLLGKRHKKEGVYKFRTPYGRIYLD